MSSTYSAQQVASVDIKYSRLTAVSVTVFVIDFLSCIRRLFDRVTSLHMGFHRESAAAGLGPIGLTVVLWL